MIEGGRLVLELGGILVAAAGLGIIAKILRQPPVLAFILTGTLIWALSPDLLSQKTLIDEVARIGVILLLFWVGMELNLKVLLELEWVSLIVAPLQVLLSFLLGIGIGQILGLSTPASFYLGMALTVSSTVLAVKFLSDRGELGELSGKIVVAILVVQNLTALAFHIFLVSFQSQTLVSFLDLAITVLKGLLVFGGIYLFGRFLFPKVLRFTFEHSELLIGSSLGFCFLAALVSRELGFSPELGAFLAGLSLSALPETPEIAGKTRLLRDLFLILFFVNLGKELALSSLFGLLGGILLIALGATLIKPLFTHLLLSLVGFKRKTCFLSSVTLSQMGEFSLIILAIGANLGDLSGSEHNLMVGGVVLSLAISSYFQTFLSHLFEVLKKPLGILELKKKLLKLPTEHLTDHIVVVGYHRMGPLLVKTLKRLKEKVLVVDIDPRVAQKVEGEKIDCVFGDIGDEEVLLELNLERAKAIFSTVLNFEDNLKLVRFVKKRFPKIRVVLTAETKEEALRLYGAGADFVLVPALIGGEFASFIIKKIYRAGLSFKELKEKEIKNLKEARPEAYFHQFAEKMKSWI